jgi:hypothetical protein
MDKPIITRPADKRLVARLKKKLEEYKERMSSDRVEHDPEVAIDAFYKVAVLGAVLEKGQVVITAICSQLRSQCGESFDEVCFINARKVVAKYCGCGNGETTGGTGLPQV